MKKELLSLFKINNNNTSFKIFSNKINKKEIENPNIENLKSHLIYFKNAVNLSLFPTAYTALSKNNISLNVDFENNMQWWETENLYFIEKDNYFESNNTEYFKEIYEIIKKTSNKLLSKNLNIVFDPKKKVISYNKIGIPINILDKYKELPCYKESVYTNLVNQVNLNKLRQNSVFNISDTILLLRELSLYFIVLEKIEKAYLTENKKEETILNNLIIFEIKKMLTNIENILTQNFDLVLGVYYCNNNINSKSCPFLLNIDISFKYYYKRIVTFIPKEIPKISKENIFIEQNSEEKLIANYTTDDEHTINYNIWESLRREGNFSNIDIFTNGKITNIEKWNSLIDEIIKNFKFSDNYDLFLQYELIEAAKEIDVLYKGYIKSINTLTHLIRKNSNKVTDNLLYKLLSQNEKINTETLEEQKKLLDSEQDFYGYLKENINGNKEVFDYYGLNINQRIFTLKSLYNLTHESNNDINKTNVIALNGPPGTGKTTVLQTVVASEIVRNTLDKKPPMIIFGCSATNQAKENIISGFKYNEIHKENIGIYERWICLIKEEKEKLNVSNLDYGFSLSYKDGNETFEEFCENFYNARYLYLEEFIRRYKKARGNILSITQEKALECIFNILEIKSDDNTWKFLYANKHDLSDIKNELYILLENMHSCHEELKIEINNDLEREEASGLVKKLGWLKELLFSDNYEIKKINKSQLKTANIMIKTSQRLEILEEKMSNKIAPIQVIMNEFKEILLTILDNITKPAMFNLSMRIQEAIFLEELQKISKVEDLTKLNEKSLSLRFTMFSRIIPVFVSTMHSLANRLKYFSNGEQQVAIGFIDLLIIDEAGQVSPEIGAISLLLSKKALIVGDTDQIEPVYNLEEVIDKCVYKSTFDKNMVDCMEWNSHASSIMEVAQKYTPWKQYPDLSKGLYLLEHNRCPIELISFCDELIYQNQLIYSISSYYVCNKGNPLYENKYSNSLSKISYKFITNRQIKPEDLFIPNQTPWKLINNNGGSLNNNKRINIEEINSIMEWLDNNYEYIILKNKNITKVVAIISPFKAQALAIKKIGKTYSFKNKDLNNIKHLLFSDIPSEKIIIGTVHSLQGAEIPIVLFSNVYGEKDQIKIPFIDKQKQIINVGVSRAKQSFYVFANRKFLERFKDSTSATGLLLSYIEKYG